MVLPAFLHEYLYTDLNCLRIVLSKNNNNKKKWLRFATNDQDQPFVQFKIVMLY